MKPMHYIPVTEDNTTVVYKTDCPVDTLIHLYLAHQTLEELVTVVRNGGFTMERQPGSLKLSFDDRKKSLTHTAKK